MQMIPLHLARMDRHGRLRLARERRGIKSAADAARLLGIPYGTYSGHENGGRGIKDEDVLRYAKAFRVSPGWLAYGEGELGRRAINVVGYVGAGAEVHGVDDHAKGAGLEEVEAPAGSGPDAVAVRVRGDSMFPVYHEGDLIIYDRIYSGQAIASIAGAECVVRAADGRTFLKIVHKGSSPHTWTLLSHNAAPMADMVLDWAAPVDWVKKSRPHK